MTRWLAVIWISLVCISCEAQELATVTIQAGEGGYSSAPVYLTYDQSLPEEQGLWLLGEQERIPVYMLPGTNQICWLSDRLSGGESRTYRLIYEAGSQPKAETLRNDEDGIVLGRTDREILKYQSRELPAPVGESALFARSGFIHPLWSPGGDALTRVQPDDHYHHVGIWNPWTHTLIGKDTIDFWNLAKGQGTVRFAEWEGTFSGQDVSGFGAVHEHVVLNPSPDVVMKEKWQVTAWEAGAWNIIDLLSVLEPIGPRPFHILAYRYQGFGYRGRASWNEHNTRMLTSGGHDQEEANYTRANWILVEGPTSSQDAAGVWFGSHPDNHDAPQTLRVWPPGSNGGEGNIFINFNPAQQEDWILEPEKKYFLAYRMITYNGDISPEQAKKFWKEYARPPQISIDYR